MSRIGRLPVTVPAGVEIKISDTNFVTVKGPKGTLEQQFHPRVKIAAGEDGLWRVTRPTDEPRDRALHGLSRALFFNMVTGVTAGFKKDLEIVGVGYSAKKDGKRVEFKIGFSHPVYFEDTDDIKLEVPAPTKVTVTGCDKQKVGQYAAEIREKRPPEPYKGKGIRYAGEKIRRKEGKAGGKKK